MPTEWTLPIPRTARYATLGVLDETVRDCWLVCHGYGQLAANFVMGFEPIRAPGRLIVAPEGLSRFYLQGQSGPVGASWMTREARTHEIVDYVGFLDTLYRHILARTCRDRLRLTALGFSQGTATVCRWVARGRVRPERVVLWGGPLLPDDEVEDAVERLSQVRFTVVAGTSDSYVDSDALRKELTRFQTFGIPHDVITFDGGHRLDAEVLRQLAKW